MKRNNKRAKSYGWKKDDLYENRQNLCTTIERQFELQEKTETPITLIELTQNEWIEQRESCIHITNSWIMNDHPSQHKHYNKTYFSNITYGANLLDDNHKLKGKDFECAIKSNPNDNFMARELHIKNIKSNKVIITTTREDVERVTDNTIFITSTNASSKKTKSGTASGIIVIAIIKYLPQNHRIKNRPKGTSLPIFNIMKWEQSLFEKVKSCKQNVIQNSKNSHFQSQGFIASFGNKGSYGKVVDDSSVSQYSNKQYKNPTKQQQTNDNAYEIELMCSEQVTFAVHSISTVFNNSHKIISPMLPVAHKLQEKYGDVNLKKVLTSDNGIWHSELCVNAMTREFHTERDVSYTLISVPQQERGLKKGNDEVMDRNDSYFLFQVNPNNTIALKLIDFTSFIFHGFMITHRQFCEDGYEEEKVRNLKENFFNIACYSNKRLFDHLKQSFKRKIAKLDIKDP